MNSRIQKNYILNTTYQIFSIIVPFITTPYLSRKLGASGVGLISYVNSIISYFLLVENLGTATYAQREIGYVQNDIYKRSEIFYEVIIIRLFTFFTTMISYNIFCLNINENRIIYYILSINLINSLLDITWFFQGMENFQKVVVRNVIFKIANVITIFALVKGEDDIYIYILSTCILSLICNATLWVQARKYLCRIELSLLHPTKHIKEVIQLFLPTVAIQIYTVLDKTMIGVLTGSTVENGYYEQADKVMKMCLTFVASLGTIMIPRIANIYATNNIELIKAYIYRSYKFVYFVSLPMICGIFIISDYFVPIFFGEGYEKVIYLLPLVSLLLVIIGLSNVTGQQYFVPTKQQNKLTASVTIGAAVNLVSNAAFIPVLGSFGAAIGSIIAESTVTLTQFIFVVRTRQFQLKKVFSGIWKYLIACAVMSVILLILKLFLKSSIVSLVLLVIVGGITYFSALAIIKEEFAMMIVHFLHQIKK